MGFDYSLFIDLCIQKPTNHITTQFVIGIQMASRKTKKMKR